MEFVAEQTPDNLVGQKEADDEYESDGCSTVMAQEDMSTLDTREKGLQTFLARHARALKRDSMQ